MLDVRSEFPIFDEARGKKPLVYLDSASTTQRPRSVIALLARFSETKNAKVHRSIYELGEEATQAFEAARAKAQRLLGAGEAREIVFVRSATEAINLVATAFGKHGLKPGDEIIVTALEHHSNLVPWLRLQVERAVTVRVAPLSPSGDVDLLELERLLNSRTKIVCLAHVSNALGTVTPVRRIADLTHAAGALLLVDGAMAAGRVRVDVRELGCDFYAMSGHKLYAPTGVGTLYGRAPLLEAMPPYQVGGDMVRSVRYDGVDFAPIPEKFEAGTPNIDGAIGLGAAIDFVFGLGVEAIARHERMLLEQAERNLRALPGVRILGEPQERAAVISFAVDDVHPHDLATLLDQEGVAVRAGHLCAQPLLEALGIQAALRLSVGVYNTIGDIEAFTRSLERAIRIFR